MRGWGKEGDRSAAPRLRHTWRLPYEATIAPGCKLMLDLCAALLPAIEPVSQTAGNAERRLLARVGLMRVAIPVSALGPWARTTACRAITARTVSAARVVRSPVSLHMLNPSYLQALRVLPRVCAGVRRGLMTPNRSIGLTVLRGVILFTTAMCIIPVLLHRAYPIAGTNSKYLHLGACVDACPQAQQEIGTGVDGRECL